jgi:hypothetical protein
VLAAAGILTSVTIGWEEPDLYAPTGRLWHSLCLALHSLTSDCERDDVRQRRHIAMIVIPILLRSVASKHFASSILHLIVSGTEKPNAISQVVPKNVWSSTEKHAVTGAAGESNEPSELDGGVAGTHDEVNIAGDGVPPEIQLDRVFLHR